MCLILLVFITLAVENCNAVILDGIDCIYLDESEHITLINTECIKEDGEGFWYICDRPGTRYPKQATFILYIPHAEYSDVKLTFYMQLKQWNYVKFYKSKNNISYEFFDWVKGVNREVIKTLYLPVNYTYLKIEVMDGDGVGKEYTKLCRLVLIRYNATAYNLEKDLIRVNGSEIKNILSQINSKIDTLMSDLSDQENTLKNIDVRLEAQQNTLQETFNVVTNVEDTLNYSVSLLSEISNKLERLTYNNTNGTLTYSGENEKGISTENSINTYTFLIGLLGLIGVFLYKLYNVINGSKIYTIHKSIVLFVLSLIMMYLVMVSSLITLDVSMINHLKFASLLLILTFILTVVEVLMWLGKVVSK